MNLVLQANELANSARNVHQESTILAAHTTFLRNSTLDQAAILVKVRRSLQATYDWGSKDFKVLVRAMDDADSQLERTMEMLRGTIVQSGLRPKGEEQKNLLDFVEEDSVEGLREAMKKNIQELQVGGSCYVTTSHNRQANNNHRLSNNPLTAISSASIPIFAI